jgi:hypothetical protein
MKVTKVLTHLILEQSRFAGLFKMTLPQEKKGKKIKSPLSFDMLKQMVKTDPTSVIPDGFDLEKASPEDMEKVKVGKYTQWIVKHFLKPTVATEYGTKEYEKELKEKRRLYIEDLFKLTDDLRKYDRFKNSFQGEDKDITKITPQRVYQLVKDLKLSKTKGELKKEVSGYSHPGATIELEAPNWTVVKIEGTGPEQHEAAKFYGGCYLSDQGETRWCTSSPGLGYWKQYLEDGPLYVILPNDAKGKVGQKSGLPVERYQLHFPSNQFMDREDHSFDIVEKLNGSWKELKEFFRNEFAKSLISDNGEKFELSYPNGSGAKFVALYGFDDLFKNIPKKGLKQLLISNSSNTALSIDVPPSLGEFVDVEAILFTNMVKSLPDTIGNLKNLNFLSLPKNEKLKKLPETLANCDNLSMINLSETPAKLPNSIKDRFTDTDGGFYWAS